MTDQSTQKSEIKSFQRHKGKISIKKVGLILAVALFFIGLVWLGGRGVNRKIDGNRQVNVNLGDRNENIVTVTPTPQITQTPEGEIPEGFPNIPLNGKKELTNSYTLKYPDTDQDQKVIDFTSSKSVKENFDFYKAWAGKNGWNILHQFDNPEVSRVIIEKDGRPLNITIQKDAEASSKVNMSW